MEYLMTYGWAILVIAVVLGVLYSLGIFSPSNFAPKAQPGSCQVFRPNGPGTNYDINLEGICSGEFPQYVLQLNGRPLEGTHFALATTNFTIALWFSDNNPAGTYYGGTVGSPWSTPIYDIYNASTNNGIGGNQNFDFSGLGANTGNDLTYGENWPSLQSCSTPLNSITPYRFYNVVITVSEYDSIILYVNGNVSKTCTFTALGSNALTNFSIPALSFGSNPPGGDEVSSGLQIANMQLYNMPLSANTVGALYREGIGGAPIELQYLVGWWPLNGNADDYGGNGYNGNSVDASFTASWENSYTAP